MLKHSVTGFSLIFLLFLSVIFFKNFFFKHLIPIPADITVGLYYPWLNSTWGNATSVPVKNPLISDVVSIIYQWRTLSIESVKQGSFPWWNPYYYFGMPLFANFQNSLVNFTNLVFFLPIPPATAWGLMIYLQIPFSLFTFYLYLKTIKFKSLSAIFGSIIFSFSLFSIVWLEYGVHIYTAAFLPLMLTFLEKYRLTANLKYLAFFCLSLALQIYGGYPQYVIYSLVLCILVILVTWPLNFKNFFITGLYILLGFALAAPLLLPGFELIQRSIHNIDVTAQSSNQGFLPTINLLTAISPNFWGNPATYDYYGQGFYDNNAFFPGTIALIAFFYFLLNIFLKSKNQSKLTITFTLLIPILFILSVNTPLSQLIKNNSGIFLGKNGLSTRFFILTNFCFAYLTANFIDIILSQKIRHKLIYSSLLIIFFWTLITVLISLNSSPPVSTIGFKNTLYALVCQLFLITTILLIISKIFLRYKNLFIVSLIIFTFGELSYYGLKYLPFSPSKYLFPSTSAIDYLINNTGHLRVATADTIPENMWLPYGLKTIDGYDTLVPKNNYQLLSLIQDGQISNSATRAKKLSNFNSPLFYLTSIKYILKQNSNSDNLPTEFDEKHFKVVGREGLVSVVENLEVEPRATFSTNVTINTDNTSDIFMNLSHNQTVLSSSPDSDLSAINSCQDLNSQIDFIKDSPNHLILKSTNICPGLLVLKDAYYPGWTATIDGLPTPIYQTNLSFRSVLTDPGTHTIEFTYLPKHFYLSLIILLISLVLINSTLLLKL